VVPAIAGAGEGTGRELTVVSVVHMRVSLRQDIRVPVVMGRRKP
jgi:hypothetical protein